LQGRSETEAGNLPGAETIVRHSCPQFIASQGQWRSRLNSFT
jgi:hypothetical protein